MESDLRYLISQCKFSESSLSSVCSVLRGEMITDVATLRAAREEDLKECGLKMGEIIRLRRALQQDGCNSEEQIESDLSDISVLQSSASELSPDDMDVDKRKQTGGTVSDQMFTAEELLAVSGKNKKSSSPQLFFRNMLRDCARGAKIWSKAPAIEKIPDSKWEIFFQLVKEACPQLGSSRYHRKLRLRLGQKLQNRRKYKRDCLSGKRKLKSSKRKTTTGSPLSDISPPISPIPISSSSPLKAPPLPAPPSVPPRDINYVPTLRDPMDKDPQFTVGHEVCIYKTTELKLKLGRGIYMGREEGDPSGMYSRVQLLAINKNAVEEEIPLPLQNEDGALLLNDVKLNSMFCWKTAKLKSPNHPSKQFKRPTKGNIVIAKKDHAPKKEGPPKRVQEEPKDLKNYKGEAITAKTKVAVAYDDNFYVGDVVRINYPNKTVLVNFMARTKGGYYTWPKKRDTDEVEVEFIFYCNVHLHGQGKDGGGFVSGEEDIVAEYEKYKNDYMAN
ncbi:uncharacterized protein LOC144643852 isoform X2 [Oculina patagonica]